MIIEVSFISILSVFSSKARKIHFFHGCLLSLLDSACLHLQDSHGERTGRQGEDHMGWGGKVLSLIVNLLCEVPVGQAGHTSQLETCVLGSR